MSLSGEGSRKKNSSFNGRDIKRGCGVKGRAINEIWSIEKSLVIRYNICYICATVCECQIKGFWRGFLFDAWVLLGKEMCKSNCKSNPLLPINQVILCAFCTFLHRIFPQCSTPWFKFMHFVHIYGRKIRSSFSLNVK